MLRVYIDFELRLSKIGEIQSKTQILVFASPGIIHPIYGKNGDATVSY